MAYCIYLRKSRADIELETHGEGETLERHKKLLLALANKQHLNIEHIHQEIVSGDTIAARPVMQQLLSEVEQGTWEGVIVVEVERLARGDTVDQGIVAQTFKYSGTKIITPMKTFDPTNEFDEEYFEFGLFMSRREYKTINRRLQTGRQASAKEGKFVGSIAPFGYKRVKLQGERGYSLEVVPENAEIVKLIFELYTQGELCKDGTFKRLGIQGIARHLNTIGISPIRHDYWQKETIISILTNPTYAGKIRWGYRKKVKKMVNGKMETSRPRNYDENCLLVNGRHEVIIDEEMFSLAQYFIAQNPPPPVGYRKEIKNPLAGLIICSVCGRSMVFRRGTDKKPSYIVCHNRECKNVSAPFHLVEQKVIEALRDWLKEHTLTPKHNKKQDENNIKAILDTKSKLQIQLSKIEAQISKAYDAYEQGVYDTDVFLNRSKTLNSKIEEIKTEIIKLENTHEYIIKTIQNSKNLIPKAQKLMKVYDELKTPKEKNDMLKQVLEKCEYLKEKSGMYRDVSADSFELTLFPKIPQEISIN